MLLSGIEPRLSSPYSLYGLKYPGFVSVNTEITSRRKFIYIKARMRRDKNLYMQNKIEIIIPLIFANFAARKYGVSEYGLSFAVFLSCSV